MQLNSNSYGLNKSRRVYESNQCAYNLKTYWSGFYIVELSDNNNQIIDMHEHMYDATEWCEDNCIDNFQADWFRGNKSEDNIFEINEFFGFDCVYFGFKNKEDALKFKLLYG